jgi:hypothetical protein
VALTCGSHWLPAVAVAGYLHSRPTMATSAGPLQAANGSAVDDKPREMFRKDYKPPPYNIDTIYLNFVLNEDVTRVESKMRMLPNGSKAELFLNGRKDVELVSVAVDGGTLGSDSYALTANGLTLPVEALPDGEFDLEIVTHIKPQENSLLEGLYKSGGNFCSQVRSLVTLIPKGIHWMLECSTFLKMCCSVRQKGSGA